MNGGFFDNVEFVRGQKFGGDVMQTGCQYI